MKKHLISTSAIALGVAMAAPVAAQEWDVKVGGYMNQHIGYRDVSGNFGPGSEKASNWDGMQHHSKSQIHFNPSITLDNGLTFGATVKLQTENKDGDGYLKSSGAGFGTKNGQIDESYMTISGDTLGKIIIGSENSAGYLSMVGAPGVVSMYINSASISSFIPFSNAYNGGFRQAALSTNTEVAGNNDVQRLTYFTPSFNGLTLGVSYAATGNGYVQNDYGSHKAALHDIFDIGANYSQTFGTTSVTLSARYGTASRDKVTPSTRSSNPETWGVGAQLGFGDFTVGGSYTENNDGRSGPGSSEGWSLGATYDAPGPWAFEAQTYQGKYNGGAASREKYEAYQIGASRDMGPGVSWDVYVAHVKADNGDTGADRTDIKGTVLGTGINLSF